MGQVLEASPLLVIEMEHLGGLRDNKKEAVTERRDLI